MYKNKLDNRYFFSNYTTNILTREIIDEKLYSQYRFRGQILGFDSIRHYKTSHRFQEAGQPRGMNVQFIYSSPQNPALRLVGSVAKSAA